MTDLFAVVARIDRQRVAEAIPPSVRTEILPTPTSRRDGDDLVLELGPWTPRAPVRHLLPSLALLGGRGPGVRFEAAVRRAGAWSGWIATTTLGEAAFPPLPDRTDGFHADIDEIHASPPADGVRLRVRVGGPARDALTRAPWLLTLSASDGEVGRATAAGPVRLDVPPRTQMAEAEALRLRICSPTCVGMALAYLGPRVSTATLAAQTFHAATDRYGVWPAAVQAAASHGVPGYLLRFPDWEAVAWCLGRGLPVTASIRYGTGELTGAAIPETTGHLIVITGLDGGDVLVNDPAAPTAGTVARRYDRGELTRVWLDRTGVGYVFLRPA